MAKLGEFIGALLADAVQARVRADMEALKIAEAYSGHELLRHMPVPRFRLPDISVDFPVMVDEVVGEGGESQLFSPPPRTELTKLVRRALIASTIKLNPLERQQLYASVYKKSNELLDAGPQALLGSQAVANAVGDTATAAVKRTLARRHDNDVEQPNLAALDSAIKNSIKGLLLQRLTASPHLRVNVASSAIKSHGDSDSLVRVRLTISEDAYELVQDDQQLRLMPE